MSLKMIQDVFEDKKFRLKLIFGDVEFLFSTCLFICLKLLEDIQSFDLRKFEKLSGVSQSLVLKTEAYIVVEVLNFDVLYNLEDVIKGFEDFFEYEDLECKIGN